MENPKLILPKQNQNNFIEEVKLCDGVYFTDYRKNENQKQNVNNNKCYINHLQTKIPSNHYIPNTNIEILMADFKDFKIKIEKLEYSIKEIELISDWQLDKEFLEAVFENFDVIIKNLNNQIICLEEIKKQDSKTSFLSENSFDKIMNKIIETQEKKIKYTENYKSEGILL